MKSYMYVESERGFKQTCSKCTQKLLQDGLIETIGPFEDGYAFKMKPGVTIEQCRERVKKETDHDV